VRALTVDLPVGLVHGEPVEREGAVAAANGKVDGDLRRIARVVGVQYRTQRVELRVGERCGEHGGVGLRAVVPLLALERRVDALRDAGVVCGIDTVLERGCRL
jgi:hypothetical protein